MALYIAFTVARLFRQESADRREALPAWILFVSLSGTVVGHFALGLNYPADRVGLYLLVLFALAWAAAVSRTNLALLRAEQGVFAALLILQFLTQLESRYFAIWHFDSSMKRVAARLRDDLRSNPAGSVSIGATWYHIPSLEFYRAAYRIRALRPIQRLDETPVVGFDYYVVDLSERQVRRAVDSHQITPILTDAGSGVILGK